MSEIRQVINAKRNGTRCGVFQFRRPGHGKEEYRASSRWGLWLPLLSGPLISEFLFSVTLEPRGCGVTSLIIYGRPYILCGLVLRVSSQLWSRSCYCPCCTDKKPIMRKVKEPQTHVRSESMAEPGSKPRSVGLHGHAFSCAIMRSQWPVFKLRSRQGSSELSGCSFSGYCRRTNALRVTPPFEGLLGMELPAGHRPVVLMMLPSSGRPITPVQGVAF